MSCHVKACHIASHSSFCCSSCYYASTSSPGQPTRIALATHAVVLLTRRPAPIPSALYCTRVPIETTTDRAAIMAV
eukprot:815367-Rhodomonas_salina.1